MHILVVKQQDFFGVLLVVIYVCVRVSCCVETGAFSRPLDLESWLNVAIPVVVVKSETDRLLLFGGVVFLFSEW